VDVNSSIKTSVYRRFSDVIAPHDALLKDLQMFFMGEGGEDVAEVLHFLAETRSNLRELTLALHDLARYDEQTS